MAAARSRAGAITRRDALVRLLGSSGVLAAACRQDVRPSQIRGLIVDVQAASFTQLRSFSLRADDGAIYEFVVEGQIGFTPGHMREHMLLGDPVIVTVKHADGLQIATQVEDAQGAAHVP